MTRVSPESQEATSARTSKLALGALGVVFGDLGTSVLYSFRQAFKGPFPVEAVGDHALGVASLVFWVITLVVSVKYVLVVMRADYRGEGGILVLAAITRAIPTLSPKAAAPLMVLGVMGASLFYGDGLITPAISVLSAIEGLAVAAPELSHFPIPIAIGILVALFLVQRWGPGKIGAAFGPVMLLWFAAIAAFGVMGIAKAPQVIKALWPGEAIGFLLENPVRGFLTFSAVALTVTGAEALYADMGQFGRGPIRLAWFTIALPALILNYLGQAALVISDPGTAANSFYLLVPDGLRMGMVILATLATIIASQAVISGAFNMAEQAINLGYLPRLVVRYTSDQDRGQVYVPAVNWMLMIGVVSLILSFGESSELATAYGLAVTGTFMLTTALLAVLMLRKWQSGQRLAWIWTLPLLGAFFAVDAALFGSNLMEFAHGGWLPLLIAAMVFTLLMTWHRGMDLLRVRLRALSAPLKDFVAQRPAGLFRFPRSVVYVTTDPGKIEYAPYAMVRHVELLGTLPVKSIILHIRIVDAPRIDTVERIDIQPISQDVELVTARFGFAEDPSIPEAMARLAELKPDLDPDKLIYVIFAMAAQADPESPMPMIQQHLFLSMRRLAVDPALLLGAPVQRIHTIGTLVPLSGKP